MLLFIDIHLDKKNEEKYRRRSKWDMKHCAVVWMSVFDVCSLHSRNEITWLQRRTIL